MCAPVAALCLILWCVSAEGEIVSTEDGGKLMKGTKGINMCKKGEARDIKRMFFTAT